MSIILVITVIIILLPVFFPRQHWVKPLVVSYVSAASICLLGRLVIGTVFMPVIASVLLLGLLLGVALAVGLLVVAFIATSGEEHEEGSNATATNDGS